MAKAKPALKTAPKTEATEQGDGPLKAQTFYCQKCGHEEKGATTTPRGCGACGDPMTTWDTKKPKA